MEATDILCKKPHFILYFDYYVLFIYLKSEKNQKSNEEGRKNI